ncbi:hypothetical protein [Streptomyces xanthophaeus]|uniref:hypothetical protein n=1 Tax=Streptomyces xanthophaeus TaxID=67385 RepID=UPI00264A3A22|nr:hypothetical protein [Streptomyces xanthophaeus]WKD31753.1 hypothetical protein KO717_07175 [Streptomyces xanthophaeus]
MTRMARMTWTARMRPRTPALLATLPLALTLALTACGSGGGGTGVASANGGTKGATSSASPGLSRDEMNVKYAQCLRQHGLDVADPKPGQGIGLSIDGANKEKADKAIEACRSSAPPAPTDQDDSKDREAMLQLARCMRENGVESFADPKEGQGIDIGPGQAEDPDFKGAWKKCGGAEGESKQAGTAR